MVKLYMAEIKIAATIYVKAESHAEAADIITSIEQERTALQFADTRQFVSDRIAVTGEAFSQRIPDISLSPCMTILDKATRPQPYCVADELVS